MMGKHDGHRLVYVYWLDDGGSVMDDDSYCHLHNLGLCPDCAEAEERDAEQAAHDAWIDNQIKWEQEERLLGAE